MCKKHEALAMYLGNTSGVTEIQDAKGYPEGTFFVNGYNTKVGHSPKEAMDRIAVVRYVLRTVIGLETNAWTTDRLARYFLEGSQVRPRIRKANQNVERAKRELPSGPENAQAFKHYLDHPNVLPRGKTRLIAGTDLAPGSGIDPATRKRWDRLLTTYETAVKERDQLERLLDLTWDYRRISDLVAERTPEVLQIGCHDFLNTLYLLFPPEYNGQPLGAQKTHWMTNIAQAFDGEEVTDFRVPAQKAQDIWYVLTDEEATAACVEQLTELFQEDLQGVPEHLRAYVDMSKRMQDALAESTIRGQLLASYDAVEIDLGNGYFAYKIDHEATV